MPRAIEEIDNDLLRIKIIAGTIAVILLGVTGFTAFQLRIKAKEAVDKIMRDKVWQDYRDRAEKAVAEAQAAARTASQAAADARQIVKKLEDTKSKYSKQFAELSQYIRKDDTISLQIHGKYLSIAAEYLPTNPPGVALAPNAIDNEKFKIDRP